MNMNYYTSKKIQQQDFSLELLQWTRQSMFAGWINYGNQQTIEPASLLPSLLYTTSQKAIAPLYYAGHIITGE